MERSKLKVKWFRDGAEINFHDFSAHLKLNRSDYSLTILGTKVSDTAAYKCLAGNELDSAESLPAVLTVRGESVPAVHLVQLSEYQL